MRTTIRRLVIAIALFAGWVSPSVAASAPAPTQKISAHDAEILPMVYAAMRSRVFIQKVAKDYLYAGNDIATTEAQKEMKIALKKFEAQQKILSGAFTDPKTKNLLMFIQMNVDEIKSVLKKPYSLDNAQEVIDLAEAISEGEKKIAMELRKKLSKNYPTGKGQRYLINQIAKYYMAYQAGIKDKNTIRQMHKAVKRFDELMKEMKAYPGNTVKMNQILNRMDKLWTIVKQFYLDIEEGGLPLIVYQTTSKLDKEQVKYAKELLKNLKKN